MADRGEFAGAKRYTQACDVLTCRSPVAIFFRAPCPTKRNGCPESRALASDRSIGYSKRVVDVRRPQNLLLWVSFVVDGA